MTPGFTVIRDTTPAAAIPKGAVVAMGNFDGVHLGHRAVIAAALQMGRAHGRPALAVTFEPHPRSFFSPNTPQFRLTDEASKLRLLAGTGLSGAVVMTFDKGRAGTTAQDFIHHDLIERLGISGDRGRLRLSFRQGPGRARRACWSAKRPGSASRSMSRPMSISTSGRCPPARSAWRSRRGRSTTPPRCSAAPGSSPATVIHGEKRGRDLGYPTANIRLDKNCGLKHGIYAVRVGRGEPSASTASPASAAARPSTMARRCWKCSCSTSRATSMARRSMSPSSPSSATKLKFDSVEALVRQMDDDSARARAALAAAPDAFPKLGVVG